MPVERLSLVSKPLAELVKRTKDASLLRLTARAAALRVLERVDVQDHRVQRALDVLATGKTDAGLQRELEALGEQLDHEYWQLQESYDAHQASEEECLVAFARARAVTSVAWALKPDPVTATLESLYEASCAFEDGSGVVEAAENALGQS